VIHMRRLGLSDFDTFMEFVPKTYRSTYKKQYDPEAEDKFRYLMRELYLVRDTHQLFGAFSYGGLIATAAIRLDVPIKHSWSLTHLKTLPGLTRKESGMREVLVPVFQEAERRFRTHYYTCIEKKRVDTFHKVMMDVIPDWYSRYNHSILLEVPEGGTVDNDLWWGMIGRRPAISPLVIKQGVLEE